MLPSAARTTMLTRASWAPVQRHTYTAIQQRRSYAKAAEQVPGLDGKSAAGSSKQGGQQQWQRKQPLATAQTLTLFSETPQGLLIALRSTLQSMTSLSSRLGPAPNANTAAKKGHHDHVLLYALSKDLPSQYLSEAVSILRGPDPAPEASSQAKKKRTSSMTAAQIAAAEAEEAKAQQSRNDAGSRIARVGILSSPLPASLIPANAIEPGSPPIATPTLYSAALSLLPGVNAIPFRSTIPGRAEVAVGRWMDRKPSWQQGAERRADLLDDGNGALPGGSRDWRDIWGRENLEGKVPEGLETLNPNSAASFIFFSDTSPHGLMEGLATQFPASSVLGLTAPPTPFETGRDQTLLISLPQGTPSGVQPHSSVHTSGAVGVALVASNDARDADHLPIPSIKTDFEGLLPFGPRREITAAQGNIISGLDNANAAQQFLRDIQTREHPLDLDSTGKVAGSSAQKQAEQMSELQARQIASKVKKEEDFFIAIYAQPASNSAAAQPEPLMLAQILSGHPSRGTLSVDTQVELGPGPGQPQGTMKTYAQFYQIDPSFVSKSKQGGGEVKAEVKLISPSAIEIPGPDPSVWVTPRFLFLSLPASNEDLPKMDQVHQVKKGGKHQVMALPNLFIAASERGWIAGKGQKSPLTQAQVSHQKGEGDKVSPVLGLQKDGSSIVTCTVPLAKATLSLRAGSQESK
ncbi:uncharacterized protein UTRI_10578_B [Ustilago trichophora]|uniref:FIST domain-containing protein n=1 Tax=Ustilago trichophora TaxID=86804 RepID=A0A5C3EBX2_9BASI|nr:uncharacterized protein UTRI_10578_B [Ustilago trichophora]